MKRFVHLARLPLALFGLTAGGVSSAQDRTLVFDTGAAGVFKRIPSWGLDTAWPSPDNMRRGLIYMGADQVDLVRVTFPVNSPLVNGELTAAQLADVAYRASLASQAGATKPLTMTTDTGAGVDAWFKNGSEVVPARWVQAMEATVRAFAVQGKTIVSAAPFNEPDYGWNQGTITNLYDILGLLQSSATFTGVALAGGSTLNCDQANTWYNPIKSRLAEGTTHQLGGNFDNYIGFYQNVIASGDKPVNEEVHSLVEVIAGAEYGLDTAIWWGTAELARGGFAKAADGVRLAYAEHRPQFTAAAVYRAPGGAVQAFLGSSERQGQSTTYRFFSRDRKVFYDGEGPRRAHAVTINNDQDRVVNITWGPDAPPPINGRYVLVNRNSGKVLEVASAGTGDGANIRQNAYSGATNQQWDVTPFSNAYGDQSFFSLKAAHSGKSADVNNFSYNDGANVQQWSDLSGENQKWFFEYAGDGWFTVRNRWSGKCLDVSNSSTANGANVQQWTVLGGLNQHWRLLPVGAAIEFVAPAAPTGLVATANAVSVRLAWTAVAATDLAGYTILRADNAAGPWAIVARGVAETAYIDESAHQVRPYYYTVRAVDRSSNSSVYSAIASATPTGAATLVVRHAFDGDALDASGHANHAEINGVAAYGAARIGSGALALDGATRHVNLSAEVAGSDQLTVAAWVYWNGGAAWQRVFDFGNDTNQYLFLTPAASGAGLRFAIKNGGAEQQLNAPALATGQWVHVAVTLGAPNARLYVNGAQVASSAAITIKPSDFKPVLNYVGKSQWPDPLFSGRIDDFRIYNYALAPSDVAALAAGPLPAPAGLNATPGPEQIQLSWSPVALASGYTVKVAAASGGPYVTLASGLASPAYTHAGLGYGTSYFYIVEATNLGGAGAASPSLGATPQSALITETERDAVRVNVTVTENQATVATVFIPGSVAGHSYQLQYAGDLSGDWVNVDASLTGDGSGLTRTYPSQPAEPRAFYRVLIQR